MAADETDGEADWLGKSLQTLTASLTVQDYRFINSATALGVSETGIMSEDVCKKDVKAEFNCVRYSFPRTVRVNASAPYEDVRRWLVKDLALRRRLDYRCLAISSPSLSSDSG
jgi:hypothetical protein